MDWSREYDMYSMRDHVDVDLRGVRLKNITVTLEDNGTEQRVRDKIKELGLEKEAEGLSLIDKALIQVQIDVLQEVVSA
ncbi:hypothetical protein [Streptomyces sp. NBC_00197]|uniref:hypothetical protein n=1 Tax=Streptomyces sp. NBC_00197 TaxID=2975676 RepID=UPI003254DFEB